MKIYYITVQRSVHYLHNASVLPFLRDIAAKNVGKAESAYGTKYSDQLVLQSWNNLENCIKVHLVFGQRSLE